VAPWRRRQVPRVVCGWDDDGVHVHAIHSIDELDEAIAKYDELASEDGG